MPAVVVTGARQTGKSTLVQELTPGPRRYFSFDDLDVVDAARRDPEVLVGGSEPVQYVRLPPAHLYGALSRGDHPAVIVDAGLLVALDRGKRAERCL